MFRFTQWDSFSFRSNGEVYTYLGMVPTPVTDPSIGGTVTKKLYDPNTEDGWFAVTVPAAFANGDFAGTVSLLKH